MRYARRIVDMAESPIRKLVPYAQEAKDRGVKVFHVNIGQPDIKTPESIMQAIRNIDMDVLAYGPSEGLASYRNKLPEYYRDRGIQVEPEDILVTTAGSEALLFTIMALCDSGDELIVPEPYYANVNGFAAMAGVTIVPVRTYLEEGFALPEAEAFAQQISERTRGILICNPNNPTGAVYSRRRLEELGELTQKHDLYLIADEVYREFAYDGGKSVSLLELPGLEERAVVTDSISKRYSACGARVGSIVSRNRELLKYILKMAQARLCPPTVEQIAAQAALDLDADYFAGTLAEYERRRDRVVRELQKIPGVACRKPEGAFYVMARLPVERAEDFAIFMLRDFSYEGKTVMMAPADGFYATPGAGLDEVRIAYVLNEEDMAEVVDLIRRGLEAYRS